MTLRRAAIALATFSLSVGAGGEALARKHQHHHHHRSGGHRASGGARSEGRSHLKRAKELAGNDDCKAAVEEYTKAYELLDDPAVLYYRAECYRRLDEGEKASDDYRAYLDKEPKTPIRAAVEAKIVALEAPEPPAREKAAESVPPPPPRAPPLGELEARAPPPEQPAPPLPAALPPAPPPPAVEVKREPVVVVQSVAVADDSGPAHGARPWVWVALAVLAAGAAVGGYFMMRPHEQTPPGSALGNYRF